MATKITTALVAALVVGALMTPNHEALARGGGGFGGGGHGGGFGGGGFHGGGFHGGGLQGFRRGYDSDAATDMDAASDFMAALPTFMARMGMAAVRITSAPTNAIEQHGALVQRRAAAAAHIRTEPHAVVSSSQPDCPNHPPEYTKEY